MHLFREVRVQDVVNEAVREGLESARQGKTMSLDQFDKAMRKKIGAPEKR